MGKSVIKKVSMVKKWYCQIIISKICTSTNRLYLVTSETTSFPGKENSLAFRINFFCPNFILSSKTYVRSVIV